MLRQFGRRPTTDVVGVGVVAVDDGGGGRPTRTVMIPPISDSGFGIAIGTNEQELITKWNWLQKWNRLQRQT